MKQPQQPSLTNHDASSNSRCPPLLPPSARPLLMFRSMTMGARPHEQVTVSQLHSTLKDAHPTQLHQTTTAPNRTQQYAKQQLYQKLQQQQKETASPTAPVVVISAGWQSPQVTRLGMFHPLEPCHTSFAMSCLLHVLNAIQEVCQATSLSTNFQDTAPLSVFCASTEQVQFNVCLWQSRNDANVGLVEIQRVAGDAVYFQHYAQQLLATVKAEAAGASASSTSTAQPPAPSLSVGSWDVSAVMAADRVCTNDDDANTTTDEALEILSSILMSGRAGRYDACRLGLESACCMTDPTKTGWATACAVSQALLAPTTPLQEQVSQCLVQWLFYDAGDSAVSEAKNPNLYATELSYLALQALAQALQVAVEAQTAGSTAAPPSGLASTFLQVTCRGNGDLDLVALLLHKVRAVQEQPHTAYYAIRALTALCQHTLCGAQVKQCIYQPHHVQDVQYAQQVGVATHQALATVSNHLLTTVLQAC